MFPTKEISLQIELFGHFLSKRFIFTLENSAPVIYLQLKWGFLNFPSLQIQLFEKYLSKVSVLTHENSISLMYLLLKWNFLNFLTFPSFRIGSILQSKIPKRRKLFNYLKTWNFLFQVLKDSTYIYQTKNFKSLNSNNSQIN